MKYHPDHRNRGLVDLISDAFESCGVETVCVARDIERWGEEALEPDELMEASFDAINNSSAVVVEFTEKGVGLGIEAGYASARGTPVFVIHRPGADVSTTLRGVAQEVFEYTDTDSLVDAARRIAAQATHP
ncbi:MAG: nucleoside 2-deoxyribosyltransferase [Acidimicrobiia bacterium]